MGRPKALTGAQEAEALRLLASGQSARKIAAKFGCDHKVITRIKRETPAAPSATVSASKTIDTAPATDDFEAAQMAAYERIKQEIQHGDHDARGLSQLVKAQNDTIKAIRLHRLAKGRPGVDDSDDGAADRVIAKLQRLAERKAPVLAVPDDTTIETETDTGT